MPQIQAWDSEQRRLSEKQRRRSQHEVPRGSSGASNQTHHTPESCGSRVEIARAAAGVASQSVRRLELDLVNRTRAGYFQAANVAVQLDLNRKNEILLEQFAQVARAMRFCALALNSDRNAALRCGTNKVDSHAPDRSAVCV